MGVERVLMLLEAKKVDWTGSGGRSSDALTAEDVAAAVARIKNPAGRMLLVSRATGMKGVEGDYGRLEAAFLERVCARAARHRWVVKAPREGLSFYRLMTRLALFEFVLPAGCPKCEGRCTQYNRRLRRELPCSRCRGIGTVALSDRERARELGLHHRTYIETWKERYEGVLATVAAAYRDAKRDLSSALQTEEIPA